MRIFISISVIASAVLLLNGCAGTNKIVVKTPAEIMLSRAEYRDSLYGFWLGQCIANWTGLVTEMDKIGNGGELKTGDFYTRNDWGKPDQPSIWGQGIPSDLSATIDFVTVKPDGVWGSDACVCRLGQLDDSPDDWCSRHGATAHE